MTEYFRRLLSMLALACVLVFTGVEPAGQASGFPAATGGPVATGGGPQSADQMSQLWDQFRTAQLKATQLRGQVAAETAKRTQLQGQIAAYTSQITQAEARRAADVAQLNLTDQKLLSLEASIGDTTGKATEMKSQAKARKIYMYKQRHSTDQGSSMAPHSSPVILSP